MLASTDNKYVRRGSDMVICYDPKWEDDIKEGNQIKEGAPFRYADGRIMLAASLRTATGMPWRQLSGMIRNILQGHEASHYTVLWRANRLDVDIDLRM